MLFGAKYVPSNVGLNCYLKLRYVDGLNRL